MSETFLRKASFLRKTPVRVGVVETLTKGRTAAVGPADPRQAQGRRLRHGLPHAEHVRKEGPCPPRQVRGPKLAVRDGPEGRRARAPALRLRDLRQGRVPRGTRVIPDNFLKTLAVARDYRVSYPEVVLHGTCPTCK